MKGQHQRWPFFFGADMTTLPRITKSMPKLLAGALCLAGLGTSLAQQNPPMPAMCKLIDRSAAVALVVCDRTSTPEQFQVAGSSACAGKEVCNAWIWTDPTQAPSKAPARDQDMNKSNTGAAAAIWVQDSKHLINLRKTK